MATLPQGRNPLTQADLLKMIPGNNIYDTEEIIKKDTEMLAWLRLAAENSEIATQVADRFETLTNTAHNRKHWTGHE
jgi:hypothetical protein